MVFGCEDCWAKTFSEERCDRSGCGCGGRCVAVGCGLAMRELSEKGMRGMVPVGRIVVDRGDPLRIARFVSEMVV